MKAESDSTGKNLVNVRFRLNGVALEKRVPAGWTLLRYLREGLGYYGTKCGCEIGECGACTVLYDGEAVSSCLVLAPQIEGADIWTIEGVATDGGNLHPVQRAFLDCGAVHCGFCSPGMVMSTVALLIKTRSPTVRQIREALAGNLCRCTGYTQIIDAVRTAASKVTERDLEKFVSKS